MTPLYEKVLVNMKSYVKRRQTNPNVKFPYETFTIQPRDYRTYGHMNPFDDQFYQHPIIIWTPELHPAFQSCFPRGVLCPTCDVPDSKKEGKIHSKEWTKKPRRVLMEKEVAHLIFRRYKCQTCNKTFTVFDDKSLSLYPVRARYAIPFMKVGRKYISKSALHQIIMLRSNGITAGTISKMFHEMHKMEYFSRLEHWSLITEEAKQLYQGNILGKKLLKNFLYIRTVKINQSLITQSLRVYGITSSIIKSKVLRLRNVTPKRHHPT